MKIINDNIQKIILITDKEKPKDNEEINDNLNISNTNREIFIFIKLEKTTKINIKTIINLANNKISCNILLFAVLKDNSYLNHFGLVKVLKKSSQCQVNLSSKIILLEQNSTAISQPFLEIENKNVFAKHNSTIGTLNPEEIFYLRSRGLTKTEAEEFIIHGFFNSLILKIKSLKTQEIVRKSLNIC